MVSRFKTAGGFSSFEDKAIARAVANEDRLRGVLARATSSGGPGQEARGRDVGAELLAAGDPITTERIRAMQPHYLPSERQAINRRVLRQGGAPVFPDDGI